MQELVFFEEQKDLSSCEPGLGNLHRLIWEPSVFTTLFGNRDLVDRGNVSILQRCMCKYRPCFPPAVFNSVLAENVLFVLGRAVSSDTGRLILISQPRWGSPALKMILYPMQPLGFLLRHCMLTGAKLSLRFYWLKSSSVLSIQAINDLWFLSGQLNQWPASTELSHSKWFWWWYKKNIKCAS